jgi:DNA modification methylase
VSNTIIHGDALATLRALPDNLVQCIVTSPPYFGLRDYGLPPTQWPDGWVGCLGLESDPEMYVGHLTAIFREARRVLRRDGSLWLNLGDRFKNGQLLGVPWLCALALQRDGWRLRADVIWDKPNAVPENVADRPARSHEYLFLFSRSANYHFEADAIREPVAEGTKERYAYGFKDRYADAADTDGYRGPFGGRTGFTLNPKGRLGRSVWRIPVSRYKGAHFAPMSVELAAKCILAGCPPDGVVYDPFMGSGTTAVVAQALGRNWLGSELNATYIALAYQRIAAERPAITGSITSARPRRVRQRGVKNGPGAVQAPLFQ